MGLKENLPRIIKSLNKPIKEIAEEIGISTNTLSNIKNGKVEPNGETLTKILSYLRAKEISEEEINKEEPVIQNIRIRTNKQLSGIEKSLLKEDISDFINILSDSERTINKAFDYFDYCDRPTKITDQETLWERRDQILDAAKNSEDFYKAVYDIYYDGTIVLTYEGTIARIELKRLYDMFGIRLFFKNLRTEKITSFSTAMKTRNDNSIVLINTTVCKTLESCHYEMAKQFFFIFKAGKDYNHSSNENISLENDITLTRAENFATKLLLNLDALNEFIEDKFKDNKNMDKDFFFRRYYFDYYVNWIKREFEVSYKLVLKQLLKSNFEYVKYLKDYETSEKFYFECLKRSEEEYQSKTTYNEDEPFPLAVDFKPYDSARFINFPD